jgi:hypothetical protein
MNDYRPRALEVATTLVVLVAVSVQTYIVLNETTHGELEIQLRYWWRGTAQPYLQRFRDWISSAEITERMVTEEIIPFLEREAP